MKILSMIIIYSGEGKGKTTAAMGAALRAIQHKKKIEIVQFLKPGDSSEIKFLKGLKKQQPRKLKSLKISSWGKNDWTYPNDLKEEDFEATAKALKQVHTAIAEKPFLLIIDEILVALKFHLLDETAIGDIIDQCNENKIHVILTGRGVTNNLIRKADLVTEMVNVRHPFDKGNKAVEGIDF